MTCSDTKAKRFWKGFIESFGRGVRSWLGREMSRQGDIGWEPTSLSPQVRNGANKKQEQINK